MRNKHWYIEVRTSASRRAVEPTPPAGEVTVRVDREKLTAHRYKVALADYESRGFDMTEEFQQEVYAAVVAQVRVLMGEI